MFHKRYAVGQFAPEGRDDYWYVWCERGALTVLDGDWRNVIAKSGTHLGINYGNSGYADPNQDVELMRRLAAIADEGYEITVMPLFPTKDWFSLADAAGRCFDSIRIKDAPESAAS